MVPRINELAGFTMTWAEAEKATVEFLPKGEQSLGMPEKSQRTTEELRAGVTDFFYLIEQASCFRLRQTNLPTISPEDLRLIRNAITESSLLNVRAMNEFFFPTIPRFPDDIHSDQFRGFCGKEFLLDEQYKQIHKRLAHLTTEREANRGIAWNPEWFIKAFKAANEFLEYLETHSEFVPTGKSLKDYRDYCRNIINGLESISDNLSENVPFIATLPSIDTSLLPTLKLNK
jgi:hypothetical protein